jgi:hypothetical protein
MNFNDAKPGSPGGYILVWWPQPSSLTFGWKAETFAGIPTFTATPQGDTDG